MEPGETVEQTAVREAREETNLSVILGDKLWEFYNKEFNDRIEHFFLVKSYTGKLKLGGPEAQKNSPSNSYNLEWIPLTDLEKISIFPQEIKTKLTNKGYFQ